MRCINRTISGGFRTVWLVLCGLLIFNSLPAAEQGNAVNWPQWRGPNRDGVVRNSPKLLDAWPKGGLKQLWKSETIPGGSRKHDADGGSGSVVVSGGKVLVYAHKRTGRSFKVETSILEGFGWHPEMSPEITKKLGDYRKEIYKSAKGGSRHKDNTEKAAADAKRFLATLAPADAKKFEQAVRNRLNGGLNVRQEYLNNLAKVRGQTFKTFKDLEAKAGKLQARHQGKDGYYLPEYFAELDSKNEDVVYCLDARTGKTLWKQSLTGRGSQNGARWPSSGTPAVAADRCFFKGSKGLYCLSMADGKVLWQKEGGFTNTSPVVGKSTVYVHMPELSAFDISTGKELWRLKDLSNKNSSPCIWNRGGAEYLLAHSQNALHCIQGSDGKVLWKTGIGKANDFSPVVYGDHVMSGYTAYKLDLKAPRKLWGARVRTVRGQSSPLLAVPHETPRACNRGFSDRQALANGGSHLRKKLHGTYVAP